MKRILIAILIVFMPLAGLFALSTIHQTKYRWRNDNGSQTAATWKAAENTQISISDFSTIRLRIEIANDGLFSTGNVSQTLEYSFDNGTNWIIMNNPATNHFTYQNSATVANSTATTNQMAAGTAGTFVAGKVVSTPGSAAALATGTKTEYEWVLKPTTNILPFSTYIFRFSNQESMPTVFPKAVTTCLSPPDAGIIDASSDTLSCHNIDTLKLIGNTMGAQISFNWQKYIGNTWADVGVNASMLTTEYLIANTDYRCIVKCSASQSDTTPVFTVHVLPLQIHLGNDRDTCIDNNASVTLDAGTFSNPQYVWDNGSGNQTRSVTQTGVYYVQVTDQFTCKGYDTIHLGIYFNPVVNLGNDTNICNQGTLVLDAKNTGNSFEWNTGGNNQQITIQSPGSYSVTVTTPDGCSTKDTISVTMIGEFPKVDDIIMQNDGAYTFTFMADEPRYVIAYDWDFGDGSPHSTDSMPMHIYPDAGKYTVTLLLTSTCGTTTYMRLADIVGINQINVSKDDIKLFPNPANSRTTILNHANLRMQLIEIYDNVGRLVSSEKAKSAYEHEINVQQLPAGIYLVKIVSDKGTITRKLQLQ